MERDTSKPDERVPWLRARRARRSFIAAALVLMVLPLAVLVWPAALGGGGDGTSTSTSSTSSRRGLQQVVNLANLFFWNLKQAGKELTKQEAAVVRIDPDRVDDAFETLEPVVEALGITGNIGAFNAAWDGFWLRKSRTCLADNVQRLEEAFRSPQCAIVLLVPGRIYHLERQILVNQSKTLVGSPAERAIVDASEAERAFLVRRGVFFDVRHILFYEGDGDVWRNEFRTRFGGVMYLNAGAQLFVFDCLFTIQPERETIFNSQPEMIFGGDILMEGGSLTAVASSFFAIVPGFVNSISTEIGGSILILGGTATFTLVNFMTTQIFAWNVGVGMHLALLGGAVNMAGCTHTANLVFAAQGLCGRNIFIGGGVGIFTGVIVTDTMATLSFFGAGLSIFIGGGLAVFTGCTITLISSLSAKFGVGVGVAIGAGMGLFYGVPFAKDLGITQFNTLGVFVFIGAGRAAFVGCPFAHQNAIASWELLGGAVYLGAGQAVIVGCAFARLLGIDFFVGLGGDIAVIAGQLVYVGSAMTTDSGIGVYIGQGSEVYVAAGGAYIRDVSFRANIGVHYYSENLAGFWVAGKECEVKTKEEERGPSLSEKGYGVCSHKGRGGQAGGIESHVVVQGLRGQQRLGGWRDELDPFTTGPAALYIGPNVSSCALCGLEGVQVLGPGAMEGGACPAGDATLACPQEAAPPSARAPAPVLASMGLGGDVTMGTSSSSSSSGKKGLFGFGGRLRRFLNGDGDTEASASTSQPEARVAGEGGGQPFVFPPEPGDDELPDTHVLVLDLPVWCEADGAVGCGGLGARAVQRALEQTWLSGLEEGQGAADGARVVVTEFKAPSALKATLGIPSFDDQDEGGDDRALASTSPPASCGVGGAEALAFVAYAHTTDKGTASELNARVHSTHSSLAAALQEEEAAVCGAAAALRQSLFVPAPAKKLASTGVPPPGAERGADFRVLPRLWINVTAPAVIMGHAYEVAISYFDQGDRVGLHLVPSPPPSDGSGSTPPLFFFQTTPRLLHTFRAFDAARGNATWTWEVSALLLQGLGPGPYFLKAFDTKEPGRFVLSQAFDIVGADGNPRRRQQRRQRRRQARSTGSGGGSSSMGHAVLRRLSSRRGLAAGEEEDSQGDERKGGSRGLLDDVALLQTVLAAQEDTAAKAGFWEALLALPDVQRPLGNATLARALLARAPVLRRAPAVVALDETGGWEDPTKVQAAMGEAIRDFVDMVVGGMPQKTTGLAGGTVARDWPARVLESLTPEETVMGQRVAQGGDVDALASLMDSQAARHFGGIHMAQVKDPPVIDELKALFANCPVLRELVNDKGLWEAMGLGTEDV